MNSAKLSEKNIDSSLWDGIDRRKTCQGCSSVYAKLLKSEKLNITSHRELFELYQKKLSKRDFIIAVIIIAFLFTLSFKVKSDFELRYISGLETANKSIQGVIYSLNDLIESIEKINQKIIFKEENFDNKIKRIQKNIDETQNTLKTLKKQVEKGSKK